MQSLKHSCNGRVTPSHTTSRAARRVRAVQVRAAQQESTNIQHVASTMLAAMAVCAPAAHAATELVQPGVDMTMAVGSGAAVAGLSALLVAADPQKRWAAVLPRRASTGTTLFFSRCLSTPAVGRHGLPLDAISSTSWPLLTIITRNKL